jgi:hypothetical protein
MAEAGGARWRNAHSVVSGPVKRDALLGAVGKERMGRHNRRRILGKLRGRRGILGRQLTNDALTLRSKVAYNIVVIPVAGQITLEAVR